ncbi:MAG: hypothetical protein IH953_00575 [Chloroflexi bacterium]|nr:hypothetical protein [Chloroflexota bacterium]
MTSSTQIELRRLAEVEASRKAWELIAKELAKIRLILQKIAEREAAG